MSALPVGVVVQAQDGRIIRCNAAAERVLGLSESQMLGLTSMDPCWRAVHEDGSDFPGDRHPGMVALRTGTPVVDVVMGVHKPDGTLTWISVSATPVAAEQDGAGPAVIATFSDITAQVDLHQAADSLSQLMVQNATDVVVRIGQDGLVDWISPSVSSMLGWTPEELVGHQTVEIVAPEDVDHVLAALRAPRGGQEMLLLARLRHRNGKLVLVESRSHWVDSDGGGPRTSVATWRDVTADTLLRARVDESEQRFRLLAENATDVVYQTDEAGTIVWISPGVRRALGWEPVALVGTRSFDLIDPADPDPVRTLADSVLASEDGGSTLTRFRTRAGGCRWMSIHARTIRDTVGNTTGFIVGLRDVHDERAAQDRLAFLAFHDPLTGLRNRAWILDILDTDLAAANREGARLAVLFLDLDNFKVVNDSLGHIAGDDILIAAGRRIAKAVRPGDRVGRFGGDEFIVVAHGISDDHDVSAIAARISASVSEEVVVHGRPVLVSASIGIALSDTDSTSTSLLRDADSAVFRAKAAGRSRWEFFDSDMHTQAMARLVTQTELRAAIADHQFVVHYQPIVELTNATVVGYEALVRWNHPDRGLLLPLDFLPVAEESGLIVEIGEQVLDRVCDLITRRPDLTVPISVNKSPVQIARPGWHDRFLAQIDARHVAPNRIIIEVTETAILAVLDRTKEDLNDLRDRGVGIHVDDFGTGYSSIALLRDLPVNGLKLDMSFTRQLLTDDTARALAAGLAGLAQGLNLDGIAEGIETPEQADILRTQGWSHGQGYLYGRPGPFPPA